MDSTNVRHDLYYFDGYCLDPAQRRLQGPDGATVALTAKPFDALVLLVEHAGTPLSRATLTKALWPNTIVEENNLTQAISVLRSTLGKHYIETLTGRGYQFVGDVRRGTHSPTPAPVVPANRPVNRHHTGTWLLAALAVAAVALATQLRQPDLQPEASSASAVTGTVLPNSIAVLPLQNLSANAENDWYAAGFHEEILNQLSKLKQLNVLSRTSVLRYADTTLTIPEIARELNVTNVMEGSLRFADGRIRVTMQLIDAGNDRHLWAETYDSSFDDVFGVETDIATNVAAALNLQLTADEREDLQALPTGSTEAYALYMRAWSTGAMAPLDQREDALLDQAIALDPDFALAHALKALVQSRRIVNLLGVEATEPEERSAIEQTIHLHATRAIDLDPNVPYAHVALGNLYQYQWNWSAAIAEYELAVQAMPSDLSARQSYAWLLGWLGRHEEGIAQAQAGIDLNPMSANAMFYMAPNLAYAGDYDGALAIMRRAQPLFPGNPVIQIWLGFMETARGNRDLAERELRRAETLVGGNPSTVMLPEFAYAYSLLGLQEDAARMHAMIEARAATDASLGIGTWVQTYLAIGEEERALELLEEVADKVEAHIIDEAALNVLHLKMNYMNDPRLREPRFVEVFSRIQGN